MTAFFSNVKEKMPSIVSAIRAFYGGKIYPAVVAALVIIGHISGTEFYLGIALVLSAALSLAVCENAKPLVAPLLMFIYILNVKHSPGIPAFSDYYFTGNKLTVLIVAAALLAIALIYFIARRVIPFTRTDKAPMLIPSVLFALALLLNGFLGKAWSFTNVLFGLLQVLVFFVLFYLFYYGFRGENADALTDYVIYVAILTILVLAVDMGYLLLTSEKIFNENGAIMKEEIYFGWGISNSMGCAASVLMPLPILGAARAKSKRYALPCFAAGVLALALSFLSLSRNAMLFSAIAFVASLIVCCFFGEGKRLFRIVCFIGIGVVGVLMIFFGDDAVRMITEYINRDTEDSGRFDLWRYGFDIFKQFPLFGNGFYAYSEYGNVYRTFDFMPVMAHNTLIQLLSAMGIFGTVSYCAYRACSIVPVVRRISFTKVMLSAPILVLLAESLLDNFIFYIYMAFPYIVLLALLHRISADEVAK